MAALSPSESRHLYSWWWDSHNSPKNSKWLHDNLTDMDVKVKSMIKLIEEDADSFARRAEMYYKKRPELMKLVEEFYRAYRALAERYNHATGELRHAHRTIAKAFPDQVPLELTEDSPSKPLAHDKEPYTPEIKCPARALFDTDDLLEEDSIKGTRKMGLKQLNRKNENLKENILRDTERAGEAENEVQCLKKELADMQAEKEDVLIQYQKCVQKLSDIEGELSNVQMDSTRLNEKASRAEIEAQTLKEALVQLETEKNAEFFKHEEYLKKISDLEALLSRAQEEMQALNLRAVGAECETQTLKDEISRLGLEKENALLQYQLCLGKISVLENVISVTENEARSHKKQAEKAEIEGSELKRSLADLNKEKEASAIQYTCCLEKISKLEKDILSAKEDVKRLNHDVLIGNLKLRNSEEKRTLLEMTNHSLRTEADNLVKKIAMKDQELSEKQVELENLQNCLQDEHLRHEQIEATLQALQNAHSQSQDDQKALTLELNNALKLMKDLEVRKNDLEEEIQKIRDDNQSLSQTNLSSAVSLDNMKNEISNLREIKERLQKEVLHHIGLSDSLQQEILCSKSELQGLNRSYQALVEQVETTGLNPEFLGTSVKSLLDENSKLRQVREQANNEREILSKKLENMEEILKGKVSAECSRSELKSELDSSREKLNTLEESWKYLHGEKGALVAEKALLLSQLQSMTDNMHNLLEKNAVLENSLSIAKVELEGLREKSKGLEEICELLKNERSFILNERDTLVSKLESVERRLENMEKRYMGLEEKYADLEKEKKTALCQVEELKISLSVEMQERTSSQLQNKAMLAGLENQICLLKEENRWKKKEHEDELNKALKAQFEISILQKFIEDMEEKNHSLIIECQKHVEASKLAEKLISELESESLEQQVESGLLLEEIGRLRLGIFEVVKALETGTDYAHEDKIENEQTFLNNILRNIKDMKCSISKYEDDKQLLEVENSVLQTVLQQLESKGKEIKSQKMYLEREYEIMAEKLNVAKNEKKELLELNKGLESDVGESHKRVALLEAELKSLSVKLENLHKAYNALQEVYWQVDWDNKALLKKLLDLKEEKYQVDQCNDAVLLECLAANSESVVLRRFREEKVTELKVLLEDLDRQHEVNSCLEKEMSKLAKKLELQMAENLLLKDSVHKLEREMQEIRECNVRMKTDILRGEERLLQTEGELLETEMKLEAAENLNSRLSETVGVLKIDFQESLQMRDNLQKNILQLSEDNSIQKEEIESLYLVNTNLELELGLLREEMEEKVVREQILSSELQEKNNDFGLWEAEAASFYFDFQISSIHEVFFRNKVQELTGACRSLEKDNALKTSEIEQIKGKICSMESEISGLKSRLHGYAPIVASLRDDITILEHNVLLQTKLKAARVQKQELSEGTTDPRSSTSQIVEEDQSLVSLQNLQMRINAARKMMEEMNKPVLQRKSNSRTKQESTMGEIEQLKPRRCLAGKKKGHHANEQLSDTPRLQKIRTKATEVWNGMRMKDIPLDQISSSSKRDNVREDDQMLELWEAAENSNSDQTIGESLRMSYKMTEKDVVHNTEPPSTDSDMERELGVDKLELSKRISQANKEVNKKRVLERLTSDAQKLENLQITVEDLKQKLEETNKKSKKAKNVDVETVYEQLMEAEETVLYLMDLNGQLMQKMEECPSPDVKTSPRRRKVVEQARKGSERIGRLQLELQKIQFVVLKMEDDKKKKNKFFRNKTIVLRDFIYNGRKNSVKRKKGLACGCFRPSTSRNGRSS